MKAKIITRIITAILAVIICFSGIPAFSASEVENETNVEFDLSNINLDDYGDVITNEELGFNLSSTGVITKRQLEQMINAPAMLSARASSNTTITLTYCYDTAGNIIKAVSSTDFRNAGAIQYRFTTNDGMRVYCIEPGVYIAGGVNLSTASIEAWDNLLANQQKAINTVLCYGLEGSPDATMVGTINEDQAYIATQLIIWEIVKGERNPITPFSLNSGKSGYLNLYCAGGANPNIKAAYNNITSRMSKYQTLPSFTRNRVSVAPVITLDAVYNERSGAWTYGSKTLNDANGVLSDFDLAGTYDVGNATVTVTQDGNNLTFTCSNGKPNATATEFSTKSEKSGIPMTQQGVLIAYGSPSLQDVVGGGSIDPPNAYMKLKVNIKRTGTLTRDARIQKSCWTQSESEDDNVLEGEGSLSTEDNLTGWYFKVKGSTMFKEKYGVDTFILGPTDATGFTQSISDYIIENIDEELTYDVPMGVYEFVELGKLKDGATGADLENDYYFPEGWRADNKVNVDGETFTGLINFSGTVNKIDNIGYATNIFDIPFKLNKVNADSASAKDFYFTATNKETGDVYLLRTDSNGNAYISSDTSKNTTIILPEGTYVIHELGKLVSGDGSNYATDYAIPELYDAPTDFDVEISADAYKAAQEDGLDAIERTVVNTVSAYIEIVKKDKDTGYTLAGAVFGIYYDKECTSLLEAVTTNAYGKAKTESKYATGTYYVQEITAPENYILDSTIHTVVIEPKNYTNYTVTINATNEKYPTKVRIIKTDEESGKPLKGVVFGVYSDKNCTTLLEQVTTDANGYAYTSKYKPTRTLYIKEISTIQGYVLSDEVKSVTIKVTNVPNNTVTVNFTNKRERISLTGEKTWNDYNDIMGHRPDEITVNLYDSNDMNTVIQSATTSADNNWKYTFSNLYKYNEDGEEIVYTVVEESVENYKPKVTGINVRNNVLTGSVTLVKDSGSNAPMKGVQFELYKTDGTKLSVRYAGNGYVFAGAENVGITTMSTDASGKIIISNLPIGSYYFIETATLDGFMPYESKIKFNIDGYGNSVINAKVAVRNNKILMFNTGGNGDKMIYLLAGIIGFFALILIALLFFKKSKKGKEPMKKMLSIMMAFMLISVMMLNCIPGVSAASFNLNTKSSFSFACSKTGYEFSIYNVGSVVKTSNPYEVKYTSNITELKDPILNGDSAALLSALDELSVDKLGNAVGTYNTTVDGATKTFTNQAQGIYYVRATNFPAGVKSVTNSVFALPYYTEENGWIYSLENIALASKVEEDTPEIVKTITNSTKNNVNYSDVSLGDTVNFEIKTSQVGSSSNTASKDFKLKSYIITDKMSKGLTLDPNSFAVKLVDANGNTIATLDKTTDYVVDIKATLGADTDFTVSLTETYLKETEFYGENVSDVITSYSAVLNKYATTAFTGNPNEAVKLTYSNKTGVTAEVEGNEVYVYTYSIKAHKQDDNGKALANAEFSMYKTAEDAKENKNAIASGVSDAKGLVEFKNASGEVIRLQSGNYYIVETKAPAGYNRYTDTIEVKITAEYANTFTNGTWISSAPADGVAEVTVTNSKVIYPQTGGEGNTMFYLYGAVGFAMMFGLLVLAKKKKRATSAQ